MVEQRADRRDLVTPDAEPTRIIVEAIWLSPCAPHPVSTDRSQARCSTTLWLASCTEVPGLD